MSILAFVVALVLPARPRQTFDLDERCKLCVAGSNHGPTDHDEAIFADYARQGKGEP